MIMICLKNNFSSGQREEEVRSQRICLSWSEFFLPCVLFPLENYKRRSTSNLMIDIITTSEPLLKQ